MKNNGKFTVNSKCYCKHQRTGNILIMITYLMMSKLSFLLMDCEIINCLHYDRSAQDPSEHLRRNFVQKQLATLISSLISQKSESQKGCFMKTKRAKFSQKRTFSTPWYVHVRSQKYYFWEVFYKLLSKYLLVELILRKIPCFQHIFKSKFRRMRLK